MTLGAHACKSSGTGQRLGLGSIRSAMLLNEQQHAMSYGWLFLINPPAARVFDLHTGN